MASPSFKWAATVILFTLCAMAMAKCNTTAKTCADCGVGPLNGDCGWCAKTRQCQNASAKSQCSNCSTSSCYYHSCEVTAQQLLYYILPAVAVVVLAIIVLWVYCCCCRKSKSVSGYEFKETKDQKRSRQEREERQGVRQAERNERTEALRNKYGLRRSRRKMSDDDFMCDSGEEYDFQYSGSDGGGAESDSGEVNLENEYYGAKQLRDDDLPGAIGGFEKVVSTEQPKGDWGFKSLKQMMKLFFKQGNWAKFMEKYEQLLTYIKSTVGKNYAEKSMDKIVDYVAASPNAERLAQFFTVSLAALKEAKIEKVWFNAQMKLGKMWLQLAQYPQLTAQISELYTWCQNPDGSEDQRKATKLVEILALEIQMHTARQDIKQCKPLFIRAERISSAVSHPLVMGVIKECGGKMFLREEQWARAYEAFFQAFKQFDECSSSKKIQCLKYLVLANMLMKSDVDPFASQEVRPYKSNSEIVAMTNLVMAYQANDLRDFEKILRLNRASIMDDQFVSDYINDLLKNIRTEVLVKLIAPYTRVRVDFLCAELKISETELESLLVACILDGRFHARIDQVNRLVIVDRQSNTSAKFDALWKWSTEINKIHNHVTDSQG